MLLVTTKCVALLTLKALLSIIYTLPLLLCSSLEGRHGGHASGFSHGILIMMSITGKSRHKYHFCHFKNVFVMTKDVFCHDKHVFCRDKHTHKMFVMTKMMLVAAPVSDRCPDWLKCLCDWQPETLYKIEKQANQSFWKENMFMHCTQYNTHNTH